jgi:hypothetical protein
MDEAFQLALYPRQHYCLGARLEPLTVGHVIILHRLNSPFFFNLAVGAIQLFEAVFICSQPHGQALRNMRRWWTPMLLRCWARRHRKTDLKAELAAFERYLDESMTVARVKRDAGSRLESCGSPWPIRIAVALMVDFRWTEAHALDCPLVKANALLACRAEMRGELKLWTDRDHAFLAWAKAQEAGKGMN